MIEIFLNNEWLLLVFVLLILSLGWRIRRVWKNFLFYLIKRKGRRGERIAVKLLHKEGYEIIDEQVALPSFLFENNIKIEYLVKPDFLVKKNGEKFIAEVKTGASALIKNRNTRRQILEYSHLNQNKTVLLLDIKNRKIKKIDFNF
tara:strand:+ start:328 stop:765 length:438 start_codon:yes stop_codon:yes gene_type:complete